MDGSNNLISPLVGELLVISVVAALVKYIRLPYTIALVGVGLVLGALRSVLPLEQVQLTPDLLFTVLLPPLLFEAALHLKWPELRNSLRPILLFAVPGLLLSAALTGLGVHYALGLDWRTGLLFGALISATDPISVLALFRELRSPKQLALVVEGESLMNDGAAVVLFQILALGALHSAAPHSGVMMFFWESGGGVLVGLGVGWLAFQATMRIDDHLTEITLTTVVAYGSYLLAQRMGVSGVVSVIVAGVVYGTHALEKGVSANTRLMLHAFWEYLGFLSNSLVFLLIGTQTDVAFLLRNSALPIAVAFLVVLLARAFSLGALWPLAALPWRWYPVLVWGGLRGSIAMALSMATPEEHRAAVMPLTFGVVILSLFGQGLTMKYLLRGLGLQSKRLDNDYELQLGQLLAAEHALAELDRSQARRHLRPAIFEKLKERLQEEKQASDSALSGFDSEELAREQILEGERLVLRAKLAGLREAVHSGLISEETEMELRRKILDTEA